MPTYHHIPCNKLVCKKSARWVVIDGGCPGRAHRCLQKSRAGKLGRSMGRAAGKCCIPGGVMGRWGGGHKFGVLSVNSWVCAPSHTELMWQYWLLGPKGIVCRSPELRQAQGVRTLWLSFFSFFFTAHPCNPFQFLIVFFSIFKLCFISMPGCLILVQLIFLYLFLQKWKLAPYRGFFSKV